MSRLRAADYDALLEFVYDAHAEAGASISQALVDRLRELIPSVAVTYRETDGETRSGLLSADDPDVFHRLGMAYPLVRHQDPFPGEKGPVPAALLGHAVKFSDVMTLRQFRRLDFYDVVCRPVGVDYVMKLFLPMAGRGCSLFVFDRDRRDFTERERDVVNALYPHLLQLRNRVRPVNGNGLTRREREVMSWVARGKTNAEIASILWVSPLTVRKHLENIYPKLGVHRRTDAAVRAIRFGLLRAD